MVMRHEGTIKSEKMAEALLNGDSCSFWRDVKKFRPKKAYFPSMVDDVVGPKEIAKVFAQKFDELYNSGLEKFSGTLLPSRATCFLIFLIFCCPVNVGGCPNKNTGFSGAPPPYAESWLEACLSVTPATRQEGSAPANAESRSGHGIMVPGRACSALQFSDFCCPGRQTGCLRALGHPIFRGL